MKLGRYELLAEVGRGGTGIVYSARAEDGRLVALKLLGETEGDRIAEFERERRLISSFAQADGFVPVLESGEVDGRRFIAMPLLTTGTLRQRLRLGPLAPGEAIALVRALARALARAHERGVVHRDLKPENVMFSERGEPLVSDLGLAKHFRRDVLGASQSAALSATGTMAGTPGYMAPELIEDASRAGPPADVFALGAILHECIAGEPAFPASGVLAYVRSLERGPPCLPGKAPPWLELVLARALARDPRARFEDAGALARALEGSLPRSRPKLLLLAAALLALVGAAAALLSTRAPGLPPPAPTLPAPTSPAPAARAPTPTPPTTDPKAEALELVARGASEYTAGRVEVAEDAFTRAIELDPRLEMAWANRSVTRRSRGDLDGSLADAQKAVELEPASAATWGDLGTARHQKGDLQGAIDAANTAIKLDVMSPLAWHVRGAARADLGDLDAGIADASQATKLDPRWSPGWSLLGVLLGRKGDVPGALAALDRAIELDPKNVQGRVSRASLRLTNGDNEGAIEDSTRTIELDAKNVNALRTRAVASGNLQRNEDAISDLTRALELDSGDAVTWANRGFTRHRKGDQAGARSDATRALELDPRLGWAYYVRGCARWNLGDLEGTRSDLERFLELAPDSAQAPQARKLLGRP
jgi:tetratricopeptide (TPR) repeat protein